MKKLLFLLLLPIFCFGQVSNGTETEFEAIKTTSSQEITSPVYLGTEGVDGTHGKIPSAYIEKTADKLTAPTYDGTGIKYYNADVMNTAFKRNASIFGHTGISSKTDQFELTVLDANNVRIKPVDFAFFLEEIYPSLSIVNDGIRAFVQKDYALSQLITATGGNINLNPLTTDGLYVRYLGYDVDGNVVSSQTDFSKNDAIAQLGFVTVVKTGSTVAFLSVTPGARNVFSQPLLADMNDLQRSRAKVSSDVRVSLNAAASIATSAGLMYGASINWRGVSNVGNTSPIDEYSVTAQSTAAFNSIDPSFSTLTASPTVHTLWTELEGGIAINNSFWNTTTSARGTMANGTASVKRILIGVRGGIFVQEGQHASTACYANLSEAINNIFNAQFDDAIVPPSVAVEIARIAYIKGTTNLLTQGYLQMTGGGTGAGSTVAPVSDATTVSKGILQLAGDLGGTATAPTVPGLAFKANDANVIHKTGNETIEDLKVFKQYITSNSGINVSSPVLNSSFVSPNFATDLQQGYAFDGTNHYLIGTSKISKRDGSWGVLVENNSALTGISGVNHLGDGVYLGGSLYIPVESYPAVTGMKIAKYDSTTLSLITTYDISAQGHECSSITTDGTILYISSYDDGTKIWKYSLTGTFLGVINISNPFTNNIQGISYYSGDFYIVEQTRMSKLDITGALNTFLGYLPGTLYDTHRGEGIEVVSGIPRVSILSASNSNIYYLNNTTSSTSMFNSDSVGDTYIAGDIIKKVKPFTTPYGNVQNGFMLLGNRGSGLVPMIATRTTSVAATGFFQLALQNADLSRAGEADMLFRTGFETGSDVIQTLTTSGNAFQFFNGSNSLLSITRQGAASFLSTVSGANATLSTHFVTKSQSDLKADLASPTFTGAPTAPTATAGTNTTQIATTAFVQSAVGVQPLRYKALLAQTGTGAPTATILVNTLGATVTYGYSAVGTYTATTSSSILTANKTVSELRLGESTAAVRVLRATHTNSATITMQTFTSALALQDGIIDGRAVFEIEIYP